MWLRLRLDIGWLDLGHGLISVLTPGSRARARQKLESAWSEEQNDGLACLSVRSGFDLVLQALDLPQGSEVLFSAITIPDMPAIARSHGLVPVPVDLVGSDFRLDVQSLRDAVSPRSRVLVLAHLFGARPNVDEVTDLAHEHGLFVVEDCAQAWCGRHWRGNEKADVSLFSFGAIKTATTLGGALCRVKDPRMLDHMRKTQSRQPVEASTRLLLRLFKYSALRAISSHVVFGLIARAGRLLGRSVDDMLSDVARGFPGEGLLSQVRRQPCLGTLRMLLRRIRFYDSRRISNRINNACRIISRLELEKAQPGLLKTGHSFWLFPYVSEQADQLAVSLREHGFDTSQRGSLELVAAPSGREALNCKNAGALLSQTVFLPCYSEMPIEAIDKMCSVILAGPR